MAIQRLFRVVKSFFFAGRNYHENTQYAEQALYISLPTYRNSKGQRAGIGHSCDAAKLGAHKDEQRNKSQTARLRGVS